MRSRVARAQRAARHAIASTVISSVEVLGGTLAGVGVGSLGSGAGGWLIGIGLGTVATGAGVGAWIREREGRR